MMKKLHLLALLSCVSALGACNTVDGLVEDIKFMDWTAGSGPSASKAENFLSDGCPAAGAVPELANFVEFVDPARPSIQTVVSSARIGTIQSKCDYGSQSVTVDIRLAFEGAQGASGTGGTQSYPFFVAVTSPNGAILAKEVFAANMNYSSGNRQTYFESMRQIIPIINKDAGVHYKVLAGFQLSPEQLAYNRAVIAAEEAARLEREKAAKAAAKAAKKAAQDAEDAPVKSDAIIVPDTTTPTPVEQQQLDGPINIAPISQ